MLLRNCCNQKAFKNSSDEISLTLLFRADYIIHGHCFIVGPVSTPISRPVAPGEIITFGCHLLLSIIWTVTWAEVQTHHLLGLDICLLDLVKYFIKHLCDKYKIVILRYWIVLGFKNDMSISIIQNGKHFRFKHHSAVNSTRVNMRHCQI